MEIKKVFQKDPILGLIRRGFKKDYLIGLDIGSSSVKFVQFIKREDGLHLFKVGLEDLPLEVDAASKENEIVLILNRLLQGVEIKKSDFILSVNCPRTGTQVKAVPYMPKKDLAEGVRMTAKNYFPFPVDKALLNFVVLGEIVEKGIKKYQILVATSPHETVAKYMALLDKLGIEPLSFIPASYALEQLIETATIKNDEGVKCFLEIGTHYTELVIFEGKKPILFRKIPFEGKDFTRVLMSVLSSESGRIQLTREEAEKIKHEFGIPPEGTSQKAGGKFSAEQILSLYRSPLEKLINEIERSFDYYREECTGKKIDLLVLLGGEAGLKGLAEYLSKGLGMNVINGDSLTGIKIEPGVQIESTLSSRLAVALGAALSEGRGATLIPPESKEKTRSSLKRVAIQVVVAGVVTILLFTYTGIKIKINSFRKRMDGAETELLSLQPRLKIALTKSLTNTVLADQPYWEDVFKELSNVVPDSIFLTELSLDDKVITMKGVAGLEKGEKLLSDFMLRLEKGVFENVQLITTQEEEQVGGNRFELKCRIKQNRQP